MLVSLGSGGCIDEGPAYQQPVCAFVQWLVACCFHSAKYMLQNKDVYLYV